MGRLKSDNETKKRVRRLVLEHMKPLEPTERSVRRFMSTHSDEEAERAIALSRADRLACAPEHRDVSELDKLEEMIDELRLGEMRVSLKTLAIHGDDLIKLGFSGKQIGERLNFLLSKVIDGDLPNEKTALVEAALKD